MSASPLKENSLFFNCPFTISAGTTKRKELHGTINVHGLSGNWIHESETVTLNTYRFDFVCDQEDEVYAGFVLLMESALDDDVANSKINLFLIPNKMVYTTVTPCGKIQLNKEQVVHETVLLLLEFYKVYPCLPFLVFFSCVKENYSKNSSSTVYLVNYFMVPE
jgi:hypothetical protein